MTIILEIKLQKYNSKQNITNFLAAIMCLLNPYEDRNVHTYATTKELKKKVYTVKINNIKEAINIHLALILENKHQIKIRPFWGRNYASILKLC